MSTNDRDILDDIDALIDEQLSAGEDGAIERAQRADRRCGHCGRQYHGLAITRRLEEMREEYQARAADAFYNRGEEPEYAESAILDGYRYDEDDSDILCPGSEYIGPVPATFEPCQCMGCRMRRSVEEWRVPPLQRVRLSDYLAADNPADARWWRLDNPSPALSFEVINDDDIPRGPGPWGYREVFAPRREWLVIRTTTGGHEQVEVFPDPETTYSTIWHYLYGGHRSIEIYACRPPRIGATWTPVSAPGGSRASTALVPATWLDLIFDEAGLWFLAPRELREAIRRATQRAEQLLAGLELIPWQRQMLERLLGDGRIATRPYGGFEYTPREGDRVGYEIGGRVHTGVVTNVEPGRREGEMSITIDDPDGGRP